MSKHTDHMAMHTPPNPLSPWITKYKERKLKCYHCHFEFDFNNCLSKHTQTNYLEMHTPLTPLSPWIIKAKERQFKYQQMHPPPTSLSQVKDIDVSIVILVLRWMISLSTKKREEKKHI